MSNGFFYTELVLLHYLGKGSPVSIGQLKGGPSLVANSASDSRSRVGMLSSITWCLPAGLGK